MLTNLEFLNVITGANPEYIEKINQKDTIVIRDKRLGSVKIGANLTCFNEILIENCDFENFEIEGGTFNDRFIIKQSRLKNIICNAGEFKKGLFINNNKFEGGIVFCKSDFLFLPASVSIENNDAQYISINNLDFIYIGITGNKTSRINFSNSLIFPETAERKLERLYSKVKYFSFSVEEKCKISIDYVEFDKLSFHGSLNSAEINMNQLRVQELAFEEFTKPSSGICNLSRIRPLNDNSTVTIRNSFLGNTSFFDCDFRSFKRFNIANSHLLEIVYSHTSWPKKIGVAGADRFSPSEYAEKEAEFQLRETYRQLKIAASKQGDKLQEARFGRNELVYLNKTLNGKTHLTTKVSLIISLISNDHKQNWILPIIWFFGLNSLFTLLLCSKSPCHLGFDPVIFFNFLNPAHRFADLKIPEIVVNFSFDFCSRIISSFLIYQTITAFRKLT